MTRPVLATIPLTPFQANEAQHGLDVDDTDGTGEWGNVRRKRGSGPGWLDVYDFEGAVYRITSGRDILRDNAGDDFATGIERRRYAAQARSLQDVIDKLVAAAGGPDNLRPDTRRWL